MSECSGYVKNIIYYFIIYMYYLLSFFHVTVRYMEIITLLIIIVLVSYNNHTAKSKKIFYNVLLLCGTNIWGYIWLLVCILYALTINLLCKICDIYDQAFTIPNCKKVCGTYRQLWLIRPDTTHTCDT